MQRTLPAAAAVIAGFAAIAPARAASVTLGPDNAQVGLVAYLFGLMPRPGRFAAFTGQLDFDPAHPEHCRISLHVDAASLQMAGSAGSMATGPALLDVAHYPDILFAGDCGLRQTAGNLTMHGVTHPIVVQETRTRARFDAAGKLSRRDFGITGWPGAIGATVGISFSVNLPAQLAAALPH